MMLNTMRSRQNYLDSAGILMLTSSAEVKKDGAIIELYRTLYLT
jgi:hypothetical protein